MPRRVIFVSGAGLSADSGIRTFRTDTDSGRALWEEYDLEEVCDIGAFQAGYLLEHLQIFQWSVV